MLRAAVVREVNRLQGGPLGREDPRYLAKAFGVGPVAAASHHGALVQPDEVAAVGPGVERWKRGDAVCALTPGGGYAEYCLTSASHCLPIPQGFNYAQAAALPENLFTVWANLIDRARLKAGEHVLIHGGSSGIGYLAIQLAREHGATVFTTVGSETKAEFCRSLGAALTINYRSQDFVDAVEKASNRRGVDVILDMVGGDYLGKNIRLLALEGRLVQIAFLHGSTVQQFDFLPLMTRRLTITGSTMRPRTVEQKAAIAQSLYQHDLIVRCVRRFCWDCQKVKRTMAKKMNMITGVAALALVIAEKGVIAGDPVPHVGQ